MTTHFGKEPLEDSNTQRFFCACIFHRAEIHGIATLSVLCQFIQVLLTHWKQILVMKCKLVMQSRWCVHCFLQVIAKVWYQRMTLSESIQGKVWPAWDKSSLSSYEVFCLLSASSAVWPEVWRGSNWMCLVKALCCCRAFVLCKTARP